jgi:hypothetical protein
MYRYCVYQKGNPISARTHVRSRRGGEANSLDCLSHTSGAPLATTHRKGDDIPLRASKFLPH